MVDLKLPKQRVMITRAPAWKRIVSFLADFLVLETIFSPLTEVFRQYIVDENDFAKNYTYLSTLGDFTTIYITFGIMFTLSFLYFVLFELKLGQTPGKMLFNMYVVPEEKSVKLSLWQIILRNLVSIPIFPFFLLLIIDPLYLIITGRRFSDIISKTDVVEELRL